MSARSLKDVLAVTSRLPGKVSLVVAASKSRRDLGASSADLGPTHASRGDGVGAGGHVSGATDAAPIGHVARDAPIGHVAPAAESTEATPAADGARRGARASSIDGALVPDARLSAADGRGVRGGVLRVPMPPNISHGFVLCRERDKGAAIAQILRRRAPKLAMLVVRKGLPLDSVRRQTVAMWSSCGDPIVVHVA